MPKKLRENIVATTEAKTKGANKLIEKLPSTISAAKTAPEIGALYAAAIPEAAPQPTSNRSRYGCHFASWPHLEANGAESWVMPPSRPIEPPVPMVIKDETNFTIALRNGSRP